MRKYSLKMVFEMINYAQHIHIYLSNLYHSSPMRCSDMKNSPDYVFTGFGLTYSARLVTTPDLPSPRPAAPEKDICGNWLRRSIDKIASSDARRPPHLQT